MTDSLSGTRLQALLWSDLTPGNYWVYPVNDPEAVVGADNQFATVIVWKDGLWITYGDRLELVGEAWEKYQFVPCRRPPLAHVQFQLEALAIAEAMATVVPDQQLAEV